MKIQICVLIFITLESVYVYSAHMQLNRLWKPTSHILRPLFKTPYNCSQQDDLDHLQAEVDSMKKKLFGFENMSVHVCYAPSGESRCCWDNSAAGRKITVNGRFQKLSYEEQLFVIGYALAHLWKQHQKSPIFVHKTPSKMVDEAQQDVYEADMVSAQVLGNLAGGISFLYSAAQEELQDILGAAGVCKSHIRIIQKCLVYVLTHGTQFRPLLCMNALESQRRHPFSWWRLDRLFQLKERLNLNRKRAVKFCLQWTMLGFCVYARQNYLH